MTTCNALSRIRSSNERDEEQARPGGRVRLDRGAELARLADRMPRVPGLDAESSRQVWSRAISEANDGAFVDGAHQGRGFVDLPTAADARAVADQMAEEVGAEALSSSATAATPEEPCSSGADARLADRTLEAQARQAEIEASLPASSRPTHEGPTEQPRPLDFRASPWQDAQPAKPMASDPGPEAAASTGSANAESGPTPGGKYAVNRGDTLSAIAQRTYGDAGAWRAIAQANGIEEPRHIRPGQVLLLPPREQVDELTAAYSRQHPGASSPPSDSATSPRTDPPPDVSRAASTATEGSDEAGRSSDREARAALRRAPLAPPDDSPPPSMARHAPTRIPPDYGTLRSAEGGDSWRPDRDARDPVPPSATRSRRVEPPPSHGRPSKVG